MSTRVGSEHLWPLLWTKPCLSKKTIFPSLMLQGQLFSCTSKQSNQSRCDYISVHPLKVNPRSKFTDQAMWRHWSHLWSWTSSLPQPRPMPEAISEQSAFPYKEKKTHRQVVQLRSQRSRAMTDKINKLKFPEEKYMIPFCNCTLIRTSKHHFVLQRAMTLLC